MSKYMYPTEAAAAALLAGQSYDDRTTYTIGMRAGCVDGVFIRDGRIWKTCPAGHADGRYPYGERTADVTEAAMALYRARNP